MLEDLAAIEAETGNSGNGELHCQHIAFVAARIVAWCAVKGRDGAVRECRGMSLDFIRAV